MVQLRSRIEGDARVDLSFDVRDVNDLLKSMVLQDLNGGVISAVSYDSQAPIEKTLQSFAVNLTGNPGFGAILGQARGEKVEVTLQQGNAAQPGAVTGSVIGVEKQKQQLGKDGQPLDRNASAGRPAPCRKTMQSKTTRGFMRPCPASPAKRPHGLPQRSDRNPRR